MTDEQKDFNQLISAFLDFAFGEHWSLGVVEFHKDWNCLMKAVDKIEGADFKDEYSVIIDNCNCQILKYDPIEEEFKGYIEKLADSKIEAVWNAVVQFIIEYNRNLKLLESPAQPKNKTV